MKEVKVQYAKTHLSALLTAVERGEDVVIARGATPVARLVSATGTRERQLGFVAYSVPADFDEPLPEDEIAAWDGSA